MPCILRIHGSNLDLNKALGVISFTPYATHQKGEPVKRQNRTFADSGFKAEVSDASWDNFAQQCKDAEAFLVRHYEELRLIEDADELELDFAYACRIGNGEGGKEISVQCDYLSVALVKVCGELSIGIALTQFPPREEGR